MDGLVDKKEFEIQGYFFRSSFENNCSYYLIVKNSSDRKSHDREKIIRAFELIIDKSSIK